MASLLEDVKHVINSPWYLDREERETNLQVNVKEDLYPLLDDYVKLDGHSNPKYKLYSTNELIENNKDIPSAPLSIVYPPEITRDVRQIKQTQAKEDLVKPQTFIKNIPTYRNKNGSCSSLNSITSDNSPKKYLSYEQQRPLVEPVTPFIESQHPKQLLEGSQELIYISHIVDPHNLYVQRACQQDKVEDLLREFRNAISLPKPSVNHVAEGKVYLVFNKIDNLWQRCRVVSIDRKNVNKPLFHVFCIDFGSTEIVPIDKLRLLPPARIQNPPPFAINCSLANCEPINGTWASDDSFFIQKVIDNKRAVIYIHRIRSSANGSVSLECDITTFEDGVSLAQALSFHGRARIPQKVSYPKMMRLNEKPKLFTSNKDYRQNVVEEVIITHLVNPDNFFVRKHHLQPVFQKLCEDLDYEYSVAVTTGSVYLPEKDMVCVVNVEKCDLGTEVPGAWARGIVRELPGRSRVQLSLPDTGALVLVHWSALRRIQPKFTILKALATECHLAGVTPLNRKWTPGSVNLLEKFKDRYLELHVEDSRNRGSLGVTLYDKTDEDNSICINTEMIKHRYAVSFGLYMFNKNTEMDQLVITNNTPLEDLKPKPKSKSGGTILKKQNPQTPKIDDMEAKDKGPLRLEAKVLNYQSPSLIYMSLVHQQKVFNELFDKIQKYYAKKKTQIKTDWKVDDRACTICNQSQTWRRAVILQLNGDNAKVFFVDFALVETVAISGLQDMPEEFASVGDAAIMCHLSGVIPAIGDEWPSLTKEYLKELLDAYKRVFITKLGKFKDKSMPIELWVYHTIQGGALEANSSEWRCLNNKIVEQGLGIPDKTEFNAGETASTSTGDDILSFFNITGSVRDWLQIEPMPVEPLNLKPQTNSESNNSKSSTPVNIDTEQEDQQSSNTIFISDWLPAEPLPKIDFIGMPTYIDNDGVIYLHCMAQQVSLQLIRQALDVRFKYPDPKAKFAKWTVGEPCIALYYLDNRFYRGKVLEVNEELSNCLIHYIDYGNEEICSFENLRKSIVLHQIPTQAHRCILNRIKPLGKMWDRQTLDYIHRSIVEKPCLIKVIGEPIGDIVSIELKYDILWVNDHLVDFEMAKYKDGSKAVVRKFAPTFKEKLKLEEEHIESDSGPDYILESDDSTDKSFESQVSVQTSAVDLCGRDWNEIMDEDDDTRIGSGNFVTFPSFTESEFLCNISVLNETKKLELNVVHDERTTKLYEEMYEQLQSETDRNALNGIYENKACVALFPEDGLWYRATILQYSETRSLIKVKYVDYGNIEIIPLVHTGEISEEFIKLPPACITAILHGVEVNPNLDNNTVVEKLKDTFLDKDLFHAKVISSDIIPTVELRDINGKLIYDKLIQENVFLKCN